MIAKIKEEISRGVLLALVLLVVAAGFLGFLHTPTAQRIPFIQEATNSILGYSCSPEKLSFAELSSLRTRAISHLQGMQYAPSRPALGLVLDQTTIREASNWLQEKGLSCRHGVNAYAFIKCIRVPANSLGERSFNLIDEMALSFNTKGKLVSINLLRRKLSASDGAKILGDISHSLKSRLGNPTKIFGDIDVKTFTEAMNSVSIEYSFKDYLAKVTASYLPWSGVVLYEQYLSYSE